jgi:hypothetical protein
MVQLVDYRWTRFFSEFVAYVRKVDEVWPTAYHGNHR